MRLSHLAPLALFLAACGPTPPDAVAPPQPTAQSVASASGAPLRTLGPATDPFEVKGQLREEPLLRMPDLDAVTASLPKAPRGIGSPPPACDAFVKRKPAPKSGCDAKKAKDPASKEGLGKLAAALAMTDAAARDAELLALEGCSDLPAGIVRALRAELAPTECADALIEPVLAKPPAGLGGAARTALLGQALAARVARASATPPRAPARPLDKPKASAHAKAMFAWMKEQLRVIDEISREGIALPYYAKALVALEAGIAEMRVVDAVRDAPLPDEYQNDHEWQDRYYPALDESLEPFKAIGRDATLVGLGVYAFIGAIEEPRVERARALLTHLYGGRKLDALDRLLLPPLPPADASSLDAKLATLLPTFYASLLVPASAAKDPAVLRALAERGISVPHRAALAGEGTSPDARLVYARARIRLGERYFRALDFDVAIQLAASVVKEKSPPSEEARLLLALGLALRDGPEDASVLLRKAPVVSLGMGSTGALDALAATSPPTSEGALAAFDAALIRTIAPPVGADPAYFQDVAARWAAAAARAPDAKIRDYAQDQAKGAEATAAAIK